MAPSSNYTLIALLVAFAVVAPSLLHQSAAARDGVAAKAAAAPAPNGGEAVVLHPADTTIVIPDLPLPRILPCPPAFPKIPFIPCHNTTPPPPPPPSRPKECRPSLVTLMPLCSGFLTNSSSGATDQGPSNECCAGVRRFMTDGDRSIYSPFCLCHILNGDVNQLLTAPVDHERALSLVQDCLGINLKKYNVCGDNKELIPPMELPKPPTPAPGNKA